MKKKPEPPTLPPPKSYRKIDSKADITRTSKRPTISLSTFMEHRIQEVLVGTFKRFDYMSLDMEALIFFTLQKFDVKPDNYEDMYKTVRAHILKNFAIEQGPHVRLGDVAMRRLTVCFTLEGHED